MKTSQNFKTGITLFVLAVCFLLGGMQCEKEPVLPPATQNGANTFGCLVDGKVFVPRKKGLFSGPDLQCQYQYTFNNGHLGYFFALSASDQKSYGDGIYTVQLTADSVEFIPQTYTLDEDDTIGKLSGKFVIISNATLNEYSTDQVYKGELIITRFDDLNQIISGNFWFDAINDKGEKVEVREGRFDMHFIK